MPTPQKTPGGEQVHIGLTDIIVNLLASATPVDNFEEQCCNVSLAGDCGYELGLSATPGLRNFFLN